MVKERSGPHVVQRVGADPVALLVGVEHVAGSVGSESTRRSHARADRHQLAGPVDPDAPTTPASLGHVECLVANHQRGLLALEAHADVECHPEIALAIELGSECVLVVVARHAPAVAHADVLIGHQVAIGVGDPSQLGPLSGEKRIALFEQSEWFVQRFGESPVGDVAWRIVVDAIQKPDLALADRHGQPVLADWCHAADFQHQSLRRRFPELRSGLCGRPRRQDRHQSVVVRFVGRTGRFRTG